MPTSPLLELAVHLAPRHREALQWFHDHAGQVVRWPGKTASGILLASKAKGIYKPEGMPYALSVRQSLSGPYPDRPIVQNDDGTWTFEYFQENLDPDERDTAFTNRGLMNCWKDVVPVGVFVQLTAKPHPTYRILGLALVSGYDQGYFYLQGVQEAYARDVVRQFTGMPARDSQARADVVSAFFDPSGIEDARRKVLSEITRRQGQQGFRRTLLRAYDKRCAITNYDAVDALEAAHIVPYRGPMTNHPSNGILLRADMHTLFDLGLVGVAVEKTSRPHLGKLIVSTELKDSQYWRLRGSDVRFPLDEQFRPSPLALEQHLEASGL